MFLKYFFNDWRFGEGDFFFFDVVDDDINFLDDFLASFDRVKEGFVEVVGGSINKLDEIILCDSVYYIIRILLWDMHMIVLHFGGAEYRHGLVNKETYENLIIMIESKKSNCLSLSENLTICFKILIKIIKFPNHQKLKNDFLTSCFFKLYRWVLEMAK